MIEELISILSNFGYPVYRQGSLSDDETYPDTFVTFWNSEADIHSHYDNVDYGTAWAFEVNVYSVDPNVSYKLLEDMRAVLKAAEWDCPSRGYDVLSDESTHTGRGMEVFYLETQRR